MSTLGHVKPGYQGTAAERASASLTAEEAGVTWWETDTDRLCFWSGAIWVEVGQDLVVENTSGGAVSAGDLGYIDEAGEFQTTTTAYLDARWAVVLVGGADNADVYVARRGRVTITLNGNCSTGDYLYTSTTAGQAQPQSYVRPGLMAVALTANAAGAGGTCEALLLCGRDPVTIASDDDILYVASATDSDWQTTENGAPAGAVVTYNAPLTSGTEDAIVPQAATELFKLVLHNTMRAEEAYIQSVNTGANTITVTAAGDVAAWQNGDTLEVRSQTNTANAGASYFFDLHTTSSEIPELAVALDVCVHQFVDTGGTGQFTLLHPYEADSNPKRQRVENPLTSGSGGVGQILLVPLFRRYFCVLWTASGAGTATIRLRIRGAVVASP